MAEHELSSVQYEESDTKPTSNRTITNVKRVGTFSGLTREGTFNSLKRAGTIVVHHAKNHIGVGIICSVAYFDPGNWGVDLQAGSQYGYHLLFVVLLSGVIAVFLQILASRLGCVTGLDLASHSRILLYDRPKHKLLYRWLGLYPLYILAEIAIIATDLAELLGSAIALCLLFPKLELWHGVIITAFDVFLLLGMGDPLRGRPVKMFEILIGAMVLSVLICMVIIITKVNVHWGDAFKGYIPSKQLFSSGAIYTSVGIIGATVMPHGLFLGSALATQDRVSFRASENLATSILIGHDSEKSKSDVKVSFLRRFLRETKESILAAFRKPPASEYATNASSHDDRENNSLGFVRAHIHHGMFDMAGSLLGFAVMINSLILMSASAVFFYGPGAGSSTPASLFDAYDLIREEVGHAAATLFAIALLASGQSSSIIATVAGQAVAEGFLQWRVSAVMRRLITRLLAMIPSVVVAVAVGKPGIDTLLVASQVVLSIVLPFISFPLLYCTASKKIMSVRKSAADELTISPTLTTNFVLPVLDQKDGSAIEKADDDEMVDYSNNKFTSVIGGIIWLIIVAANLYAIVTLAIGN